MRLFAQTRGSFTQPSKHENMADNSKGPVHLFPMAWTAPQQAFADLYSEKVLGLRSYNEVESGGGVTVPLCCYLEAADTD